MDAYTFGHQLGYTRTLKYCSRLPLEDIRERFDSVSAAVERFRGHKEDLPLTFGVFVGRADAYATLLALR